MNVQSEITAFKELYNLCKNECLSKLRRYTQNPQDAEDVFAEAISIFWVKSKQGKIKNSKNIPAYVFTIAKNLHFNNVKKELKTEDLELVNSIAEFDESNWSRKQYEEDKVEKIKNCLKQLNVSCQQMLIFKYGFNYSYEELAVKFNRKSADSIKTQTHRCLKKLKDLMKGKE